MPTLNPAKKARLSEWLREFASDFAQKPKGVAHLAKYVENRKQGREYYAQVKTNAAAGKDITDGVLDTLLPHDDTAPIRARGAWVHVAPVISGNIRPWFENAGWAQRKDWPEIARMLFKFFDSCEREPEQSQKWCNEFVKHPLRKGFKAGFLSPMLNALHPEQFAIVNKKPLALLSWAYDDKFTSSLENYARTTTFLHHLSRALEPQLTAAVANGGSAGDALDMFAHWLVTTRRLEGVAPEADGEEDAELTSAKVEEAATKRLWLIAAGRKAEAWSLFQDESCMAMNWTGMDSLLTYPSRDTMTEGLRSLQSEENDRDPTNGSLACWEFSREIQPGDLVIAKEGKQRLLGVGVVAGAYTFAEKAPSYRHRLPVRWLKTGDWTLKGDNLPLKTLTEVTDVEFRHALELAVGGLEIRPTIPVLSKSARHWWMNFNPAQFDVEAKADGHREPYTTNNANGRLRNLPAAFDAAQPGDLVVGYSTTPRTRAAVLCRITKAKAGEPGRETIEFERIRALKRPVTREEMLADERLQGVGALKNPRGSLFPLRAEEFEVIMELSDDADDAAKPYTEELALAELFMSEERLREIRDQLARKRNIVLQGPPGVGKTFVARRLAWLLLGGQDDRRIEMVQFHPSMSYEDFVLGLRPDSKGGFVLKPGIFHRFCRRAQGDLSRPYVFIIDEINRGNLAKIFGELLMLIEADKRGEQHAVPLAYGHDETEKFYLPPNLHLIGTMNTADRSLALVDYALRRRFAFLTIEPVFGEAFKRQMIGRGCREPLVNRICTRIPALNLIISGETRSLGRGYQIGHSFFCSGGKIEESESWYRQVIEFEIRPLLEEYWMDDPAKAETEVARLLAPA